MATRLPIPGSDEGAWGNILNDFLGIEHNADGTLKTTGSLGTKYTKPASGIPKTDLDAAVQTSLDNADSAMAGIAPDATTTSKGIIRLSGDLTGSALSPQIAAGAVTGGGGGHIQAGTITDANIHASASIAKSKLAPLAIADGDVASGAAIAQSKIAGLTTDMANKASTSHTHAQSDVTGLTTALSSKADAAATTTALNAKANTTDVNTALSTKANTTDVNTALSAKADTTHTHAQSDVTGLTTALSGKADTTHTHAITDTTGLQTALDDKATTSDLTTGLAGKASTSDLTTGLAGKADTSHTHTTTDISDFDQEVSDAIGSKIIPGSNVSVVYDALSGETTISSTGGTGEPSATVTSVAGRTGDVILTANDITSGTISINRIPDLDTSKITTGILTLNRIPTGTTSTSVALGDHTHTGYANTAHTHAISDTTNLQTTLDGKASTTDLTTGLAGKADTTHVHDAADVTSGTFDAARIPNLSATKISSDTLDIARIPTGSTGTTVSLGNHTHTGYAATAHTHDDRYYTETESDAALALKLNTSEKGAANGVATLGADSKIPTAQLPAIAINETFTAASEVAMLALSAERGDMCIRTDTSTTYVLASDSPTTLADWKEIVASGAVTSVNGQVGTVSLTKSDVGLANVDNTSDASKPISTATQTALDLKANTADVWTKTQTDPVIAVNEGDDTSAIPNGTIIFVIPA